MTIAKTAKWLALAATMLLGGCIEITSNTAVQPNGSLTGEVEVAISMQMVAFGDSMAKEKGQPGMLDQCEAGNSKPQLSGVSAKASKGMRGDMMTCTFAFKIGDPISFAKSKHDLGEKAEKLHDDFLATATFDRLGDNAYRLAYVFTPKSEDPNDMKGNPFLPILMASLANHYVTFTISGQRIENTNGVVSEGGRRVTWKLPVAMLMMPPAGFKPEIRADIYFGEDSTWDLVKAKTARLWQELTH